MEINKDSAISYIRSDISSLSEQTKAIEIRAYVNRIRGQLNLLFWTGILSSKEVETLEDEMAKARSSAAEKVEE